jgi:hypothetical protein
VVKNFKAAGAMLRKSVFSGAAKAAVGFRGSTRVLQQCIVAAGTRQAASSMSISVSSLSAVRGYGAPRMLVSAKGSRAFSSNLELVLRQVDSALATVKNAQDIIMAGLPSALCTIFPPLQPKVGKRSCDHKQATVLTVCPTSPPFS